MARGRTSFWRRKPFLGKRILDGGAQKSATSPFALAKARPLLRRMAGATGARILLYDARAELLIDTQTMRRKAPISTEILPPPSAKTLPPALSDPLSIIPRRFLREALQGQKRAERVSSQTSDQIGDFSIAFHPIRKLRFVRGVVLLIEPYAQDEQEAREGRIMRIAAAGAFLLCLFFGICLFRLAPRPEKRKATEGRETDQERGEGETDGEKSHKKKRHKKKNQRARRKRRKHR